MFVKLGTALQVKRRFGGVPLNSRPSLGDHMA